jgi:pantoate--beta-alanine ligase
MILATTIRQLNAHVRPFQSGATTGFVPTMGALHQGHLALVRQAVSENKQVVVSIFVNPTQFNDPKDLKNYPKNLDADLRKLEDTGCDIVFAPAVEEIYPHPDHRRFDFGPLDQVMEGKFRPGHFNGVAQVVSRLFAIVKPDRAYFGLKDFQQVAIIKKMTAMLQSPVEIVSCATVRESNGLAMSSRNQLLTEEEREQAAHIYKTLTQAAKLKSEKNVIDLKRWVVDEINNNSFLTVEYFEIVDNENLQPVASWKNAGAATGCIAVFCGKVRLIDNIQML